MSRSKLMKTMILPATLAVSLMASLAPAYATMTLAAPDAAARSRRARRRR